MMMDVFRRIYLSLFGVIGLMLLLSACSGRPNYVLSPKKMEAVLYDYHIARGMADQGKYEDRFKAPLYVQDALAKHNVSLAQFDSSMVWYSRRLPEFSKIYKNLSARFDQEKTAIDSLVTQRYEAKITTQPGDSIDIWAWSRLYRLTGNALNNYVSFAMQADDNFEKGDYYQFTVGVKYLNSDTVDLVRTATLGLNFKFTDGKQMFKTLNLDKDSIYSIAIKPSDDATFSSFNGFLYYPPQVDGRVLMVDSISLYRLHLMANSSASTDNDEVQESIDNNSSTTPELLKENPRD